MTEQQTPIHAVGSLVRHKHLPDNTLALVIEHDPQAVGDAYDIIVKALKTSEGNPSGIFPTISVRWELVSSS